MRRDGIVRVLLAIVLALVLGACGGGGGSKDAAPEMPEMPPVEAPDPVATAIEAAKTAIEASGGTVPADVLGQAPEARLAVLQHVLRVQQMANAAAAKAGREADLAKVLGVFEAVGDSTLPSDSPPDWDKGGTAPEIMGWNGTARQRVNSKKEVTGTSYIYDNLEMKLFRRAYTGAELDTSTGLAYWMVGESNAPVWTAAKITGAQVAEAVKPTTGDPYVRYTAPGTVDGTPGTFSCAVSDCGLLDVMSNGVVDGTPTGWRFVPSDGLDAQRREKVTEKNDYLSFGYWVTETSDGPTVALYSAASGTDHPAFAAEATMMGTASYTGKAAGKYAVVKPDLSDAGSFTADASLTADFDAVDDQGVDTTTTVEGTIDNFSAASIADLEVSLSRHHWEC